MTPATVLTLATLAAAGAAPASEAAPEREPELRVVDHPFAPGEVPEGSREDQLLWTRARDGMAAAMDQIGQSNQLRFELRYAFGNLDELEKSGPAADVERLHALRARLEPTAKALDDATPRAPLGGCRYTLLYFEQSMSAPEGTDAADRLAERRRATEKCADDTTAAARTLAPAVQRTRAVLDEVGPEIRQKMAAYRAANPMPAAASGTTPPTPAAAPAATPVEAAPAKR